MWRVSILAIIGLLALAAPAAASHQAIPPDNSGAGQYTENVPDAGGDKPSDQLVAGGGSDGSGSGGALPPGAEDALDSLASQGPLGAAAAGLARAGAEPSASDRGQGGPGGPAGSPRTGSAGEDEGSVLGELFGQLTGSDSDGMGIALPILLALSVVAAVLIVLARQRRRTERSIQP